MISTTENERVRKIFGNNIRNLRKSMGYSQEKFARILGISQAAVSAWEIGAREPEFGTLLEVSRTFRVPVSSLLPIEETGNASDLDQRTLDMLHQNPRLCVTFDKTRHFDERQLNMVISVIDAIAKEREPDES